MRGLLALGGALALAGCAANERVTLLAPVQAEKIANNDRGSLVVEDEAGGTLAVIDGENQQARLRGRTRAPQLATLPETDQRHIDIVNNFPPAVGTIAVPFEVVGSMVLSEEQKTKVADDLRRALQGRPAPQIEVIGHTDSDGGSARNFEISQQRAEFVAGILRELGFEIDPADVLGRGEVLANSNLGDGVSDVAYRRADVIIR